MGEGGQGGSAGASSLGGLRVFVTGPSGHVRSNDDGTFSLLLPDVVLSFGLHPEPMSELFFEPMPGPYDPRWGVIALVAGEQVLEQRRFFLFAESNCLLP